MLRDAGHFATSIVTLWINVTMFWFNASLITAGDKAFTIIANYSNGTSRTTTKTLTTNFAFSGYVRNETGGLMNNVNITMYKYRINSVGPATETEEISALTNENGIFNFSSLNGSAQYYYFKMIKYGNITSACFSSNTTCNATKVGSPLPPLSINSYYPATSAVDIALNGSTFYLEPATTLRSYANTGLIPALFGHEVIDQKIGFPVSSDLLGRKNTTDVVVPISRDYKQPGINTYQRNGNRDDDKHTT